jgi:hypothetical protein
MNSGVPVVREGYANCELNCLCMCTTNLPLQNNADRVISIFVRRENHVRNKGKNRAMHNLHSEYVEWG